MGGFRRGVCQPGRGCEGGWSGVGVRRRGGGGGDGLTLILLRAHNYPIILFL